ncbi:urease accessory protein UreD [Methylobacterium durans]|uniref:urease accessory protein UreD n=1 Tax=Methylobacterium durans TaxID=2202825 RepID=UPI002B003AE4|nr:urease accessory protein UreD [Methylobacterium durans]MEA1833125.1 urease accessory protein UreD [Methylobacterium durans]
MRPLPPPEAVTAPAPLRQRSHGRIRLRMGRAGAATIVADLAESGPSRLRFPRTHGPMPEAVLVNTAGGIACGDRFEVGLDLDAGSDLVLTTNAAEKIYRSDGPASAILNRVALGAGARLAWLPQETILYDRARLERRFEVDLAEGAGLLACEIVMLGRAASGEVFTAGAIRDRWSVRRAGRLVYADALALAGPVAELLARSAIGGGARAFGTILDLAPGAEARIDEARALLDGPGDGLEAGASAWNGHLAVRLLGRDPDALRRCAARFLAAYRREPLPRVWQA